MLKIIKFNDLEDSAIKINIIINNYHIIPIIPNCVSNCTFN